MAAPPSLDELIELVHRYYPAGVENYEPQFETAPETQRLWALLDPVREGFTTGQPAKWTKLRGRIREAFSGCMTGDESPPFTAQSPA